MEKFMEIIKNNKKVVIIVAAVVAGIIAVAGLSVVKENKAEAAALNESAAIVDGIYADVVALYTDETFTTLAETATMEIVVANETAIADAEALEMDEETAAKLEVAKTENADAKAMIEKAEADAKAAAEAEAAKKAEEEKAAAEAAAQAEETQVEETSNNNSSNNSSNNNNSSESTLEGDFDKNGVIEPHFEGYTITSGPSGIVGANFMTYEEMVEFMEDVFPGEAYTYEEFYSYY